MGLESKSELSQSMYEAMHTRASPPHCQRALSTAREPSKKASAVVHGKSATQSPQIKSQSISINNIAFVSGYVNA